MQRGTWNLAREPHLIVGFALAIGVVLVSAECTFVQPPQTFTGALPKPLDSMTKREFADFVAQLRWIDSSDTTRRCDTSAAGGAACAGRDPAVTTRARILGEVTAERVGAPNSPRNGAVVWKLVNLGTRTENRYKLRPGRYSYYVVVFPRARRGALPTWRMVEVDEGDRSPARDTARVGPPHISGFYRACRHEKALVGNKKVLFLDCPRSGGRGLGFMNFVARSRPHTQQVGLDEDGWGKCPWGCCAGER
jgi:hypothetical protein